MSDQTIHSPNEAKGKAVMVGDRGGLHTKDGIGPNSNQKQKSSQPSFIAPLSVLIGDGYDIAYFRDKSGYLIRYKGPRAIQIINDVKEEYMKTGSFLESLNTVRSKL